MNQPYQTVVDVWEGSLEINESALIAGGISGMIIRLNGVTGALKKDADFDKQWAEATAFVRAPYFVYDPWDTGAQNFDFLAANMPAGCPSVLIDTELHYEGLAPAVYGAQYGIFMGKCKAAGWKRIIYTGGWFLPYLTPWPMDVDYWWSAYPNSMYPNPGQTISYAQLHTLTDALVWPPSNWKMCPGPLRMWQCSGDRLTIPGSQRPIDISVFPGTSGDLRIWLGYGMTPPPPPVPLTLEQRVARLEAAAQAHGWSL